MSFFASRGLLGGLWFLSVSVPLHPQVHWCTHWNKFHQKHLWNTDFLFLDSWYITLHKKQRKEIIHWTQNIIGGGKTGHRLIALLSCITGLITEVFYCILSLIYSYLWYQTKGLHFLEIYILTMTQVKFDDPGSRNVKDTAIGVCQHMRPRTQISHIEPRTLK